MEINTGYYLTDNQRHNIYLSHHPTVQELEMYKACCYYGPTLNIIDLKLAAATATPTVLGETMTVRQLFELGDPLWTRPYSISELSFIIPVLENIGDERFKQLLGRATNYKTLEHKLIEALDEL